MLCYVIDLNSSETERRVIHSIQAMLARPDFLVPIAAAERQFRDHYYGLNSAALLEDLFFDALGNFLRQTEPATQLVRPPTGQKGWDYAFDGLQISHKVSQKLGDIAAIWDATKKGVTSWSFNDPIIYVLGGHNPATGVSVEFDFSTTLATRSVADLGRPYLADGRAVMVISWPADGRSAQLLDMIATDPGQSVADVLPFSRLWQHVAAGVREGGAANEVEVLITNRKCPPLTVESVKSDGFPQTIGVSVQNRGGAYLFPREILQGLPVKTNNRAILIPRETIQTLLGQAAIRGLFAPLPLWYWVYAQERPPDMYSIQRAEYDARFSARGDLDVT